MMEAVARGCWLWQLSSIPRWRAAVSTMLSGDALKSPAKIQVVSGAVSRWASSSSIWRWPMCSAPKRPVMIAQAREQFVTAYAGVLGKRLDRVASERVFEVARRNVLILTGTDPGFGNVAVATLLKLFHQVAETAGEHAAGGGAAEKTSQPAAQHIRQTTALGGAARGAGRASSQ